jgi:four helix bundle protein
MRRASSSIPLIAEGYGKYTRPEYMKGLRTAMGSLCELCTAYEIATELEMLKVDPIVLSLTQEVDRLLQAILMKLEAKTREEERERARAKRRKTPN